MHVSLHRLTLAVASGGPSVSVGGWMAILVVTFAVVSSVYGTWKILWPIVRFANKFEEKWPTLEQIATDFKGNGGGTLGQQVARIEKRVIDTQGEVAQIKADRAVQLPMFEANSRKLDELYRYSHDNVHTLGGVIQEMQTKNETTEALTAKLAETVDELRGTRLAIDNSSATAATVVETARVAAAAVLKKAEEDKQ